MENTSDPDGGQRRTAGHPAEGQEATASPPPAPKRRGSFWDEGLTSLAVELQRALPGQLRGERPGRLAGSLSRFFHHGWTALSLETEIRQLHHRNGRALPHTRPDCPYAWLAAQLRQLDPAENPDLIGAVGRYNLATADTEPCPHDVPGGARIQYRTSAVRCPLCRASDRAAARLASGS